MDTIISDNRFVTEIRLPNEKRGRLTQPAACLSTKLEKSVYSRWELLLRDSRRVKLYWLTSRIRPSGVLIATAFGS